MNAPTATYGVAGALHVSGAASTNFDGQMTGVADTWLRYDSTTAIQQFNTTFGVGNWVIDSVALSLQEVAAPMQPIFSRGVGDFQVDWIVNDNWSQGLGSPGGGGGPPGTATGNQIGWSYGQSLLSASDQLLGTFQNAGANDRQEFSLSLNADFLADFLTAGPDVTLRLSAASDSLGFTFFSSDQGDSPRLIVNALQIPEPATALLVPFAFAIALQNRRRTHGS